MKDISWSSRATKDMARLRRFLATDNPAAAKRAVAEIRKAVRLLAANPDIGRPADEFQMNYREWLIPFGRGGYVVLYRRDPGRVVLLTIRHSRELGL